MSTKPELTLIEGDRAKVANDVKAQFATDTEILSIECDEMAGYVVIAWDAEGFPCSAFKLGPHNPIPHMMVPSIVKDILSTEMFEPS